MKVTNEGIIGSAKTAVTLALGLIGIMPLITGLAGRCPGYRLLGLSTCPIQKK
ncbi:DUF2892 domain-containing protein, partial [Sphingobacteriales bacterium CHB3]|nr:DUF2892 domain-containing protein [Sphingobacteriales bacterium CHB3]